MVNSMSTDAILESLEPMFKEAKEKGLWFYLDDIDEWVAPDELRKNIMGGKFIWVPSNWILRDPREHIKLLEARIISINNQIEKFKERIIKSVNK